jgi:predicted tellurium resistance membrane protein TerC
VSAAERHQRHATAVRRAEGSPRSVRDALRDHRPEARTSIEQHTLCGRYSRTHRRSLEARRPGSAWREATSMLHGLRDPSTWLALASLVAMEVVLGIDNIVFITILTGRLPEHLRQSVARLGIGIALGTRIALLFAIQWVMSLTREITTVLGVSLTGKWLILLIGGLFLIAKATIELHNKLESASDEGHEASKPPSVSLVIVQIVALDLIFSLDSVITAVGMIPPEQLWVMVTAILVSVAVMLVGARPIGEFVTRHPTMKVLALAFLILIGVMLIAEGIGEKIPKGYIYFAMAFSLAVEAINMRLGRKRPERAPAATT